MGFHQSEIAQGPINNDLLSKDSSISSRSTTLLRLVSLYTIAHDSLGTKSRRKRLWDYLGGPRSKQTRGNLVRNVIAWIVVMTARF